MHLEQQVLNTELNSKYKTVEELIAKKTEESASARRKADMLQDEAKALLAQANSKLQLLKGKAVLSRQVLTLRIQSTSMLLNQVFISNRKRKRKLILCC